jgi:hypothetical protein
LVAAAMPTYLSAQSTPHLFVSGEAGVASATNRWGLAVALGPTWHWRRISVNGLFEAQINSVHVDHLDVGNVSWRSSPSSCSRHTSGQGTTAPSACRTSTDALGSAMLDATFAPFDGVPVAAGIGYRLGVGRGAIGVLSITQAFRANDAIVVHAQVGQHYTAIRAGLRLVP